jgi:hypothetical protein
MSEIKIFYGFSDVLTEVGYALVPLLIFFAFFQVFMLKLPKKQVYNALVGIVLTFWGLAFFLQGVHIGFMPVGKEIGNIVGDLPYRWILIPIGFVLGFVATFAEPAVRVLNHEVDKVSAGFIPKRLMLYTLSTGVAFSIALAMIRILFAIPLWYFIIPGYGLALTLMYFNTSTFTSIAFDSGGVATGPMTVTFILAIALGFSEKLAGSDPLLDGFGMISLVALAPILSVLILGILYRTRGIKDD